MREELRTIQASDGTEIHVTLWHPEGPPRFAVLVSHGQSEHMGRHAWLAEHLVSSGALVFGPDHRGEGRSGGPRGYVESFEVYAQDLAEVMQEVSGDLPPDCPRLLFCHSMGGLIGLHYLLDHGTQQRIRAAVVSAPLIQLALDVGAFKRWAAGLANWLVPKLPFPSEMPSSEVLKDPELRRLYDQDPLRTEAVTPRWFAAMKKGQARVQAETKSLTLPMFWYGGDADKVCSTPAAKALFDTLPDPEANDQSFEVLGGVLHEPHNETPEIREPIRAKAAQWLRDHIS